MKTYDNHGKLVCEINRSRTADGTSITTNTIFNTHNGQVANQNITVQDSKTGKVTSTNIIGGKLMP